MRSCSTIPTAIWPPTMGRRCCRAASGHRRTIRRLPLSRVVAIRPVVARSLVVIPRDNYLSPARRRIRSSGPLQIEAGSGVVLAAFWMASRTILLSAEA